MIITHQDQSGINEARLKNAYPKHMKLVALELLQMLSLKRLSIL